MTSLEPAPVLTDVDGVATVWADVPGPLRAGLLMRVGTADETAPLSGVTHLLEHLALFGLGRPGDHSNGFTAQTTTMFHTVGDARQVTDFLAHLSRQLQDPPLRRLDAERKVLAAEQAGRSNSLEENLLTWRYGAQTYGVAGLGEIGRRALGAEAVTAWAARFANRLNVVLWLTGPPPPGLRLHLPDGEAQVAPDPLRTIVPQLPAFFSGGRETVGLHTLLPRGYVNQALTSVLSGRLVDELRTRRAVAYSPQVDYRPLTGDTGQLFLASDLLAGRQSDGVRPFLAALHDLSTDQAVSSEELEVWRAHLSLMQSDPHFAMAAVSGAAWETLFGRPINTPDMRDAAMDAITPDDVTAAAAAALSRALAQIPTGVRVTRDPWVPAPLSTVEPLTGRLHAHLAADVHDGLDVSPEGITLRASTSNVTVRRDGAAAVQAWDDGRRVLIGADAVRIVVEPNQWVDGAEVVADIDSLWATECRIDMGSRRVDEIPRTPPAAIPEPVTSAGRRRLARLGLWSLVVLVTVLIVLATVILLLGAGLKGSLVAPAIQGLVVGICGGAVVAFRKRRPEPPAP